MRRYEIDWIRNISILLLFVYHTAAIFCQFGDFYIMSENKNIFANIFILALFVWYMPLLFFLAGASTYFSLGRRSFKEYVRERVERLVVPFIFGIIVLIPPQTYLARLWRGESNINYIEHMKFFFANVGDLSGFDGKFTPAHLWFIAFLFIVSVLGATIILTSKKHLSHRQNIIKQLFLGRYSFLYLMIIAFVSEMFPSMMGKNLLTCLILFIFGYIAYSDEIYLKRISECKSKFLYIALSIGLIGIIYVLFVRDNIDTKYLWTLDTLLRNGVLVSAIIMIVGYSMEYMNKDSKVLQYLNKVSMPIYIIHQTILVWIAYYIVPSVSSTNLAIIIIIGSSSLFTWFIYTFIRKIDIINYLLGSKNVKKVLAD